MFLAYVGIIQFRKNKGMLHSVTMCLVREQTKDPAKA